MKKVLPAICLIVFHFISNAQVPYPLVTPGAKYFTDGSEIYYLETSFNKKNGFENIYNVNTQYFKFCNTDSIAWIGKVKNANIKPTFSISVVNDVGLSSGKIGMLMIEPWKKKGQKTFSLLLPSGKEVWNEIVDVKWETFLGVIDSVKTIKFYLSKSSNIPEEMFYDSLYFKISRNYGIIETRLFESYQANGVLNSQTGLGNKVKIIGIADKKLGWKPKSLYEFFDFQVGDILRYEESNTTGFQQLCITEGWAKIKILEKKVTKDSLIYKIEKTARDSSKSTCNATIGFDFPFEFKTDTLLKINTPDNLQNFYFYRYSTSGSILYKQGGCNMMYPRAYQYEFKKGLVSIRQRNGSGGIYKLDLAEIIINSNPKENFSSNDLFIVAPNPATNSLQISSSVQGNFQLLNTSGIEVLSTPISDENIDISSISPGMYFFKVITDQKILKSGKLIIQ